MDQSFLLHILCVYVVHNGDVGNVGISADKGTLGALQLVARLRLYTVKALLAEGVSAAAEKPGLEFPSSSILTLAQWAGKHGTPL